MYYKIRKLKDASPAQPVNSESDAQVNPVELNITKLAFVSNSGSVLERMITEWNDDTGRKSDTL